MAPTREAVVEALGNVIDPELRKPVTELDMVRDVAIREGEVTVRIALTVAGCPLRSSFQDQVAKEVGGLDGVSSVRLDFDVMTPDERSALTSKLRGGRPADDKAIQLEPTTRVIAVASGKGGVGKSSITVNLAAALSALGRQVGVLDADIYGHSVPHMLGLRQKPVLVDRLMIPPVKHDLKLMSIGFFLDDNEPLMWRGPMLHRALEQFLQDVHWGELDVLLVDMPPGTGDVSISLGQMLPRAEAIVVTTPQALAQEVASRAAAVSGREGHGFRRIEWLETLPELRPNARPKRVVAEPGYERWQGEGALGYFVLDAATLAQLAKPPEHARLVVCDHTFPTGML